GYARPGRACENPIRVAAAERFFLVRLDGTVVAREDLSARKGAPLGRDKQMDRRMMLWGCLAGVTAATTRVGAMSQASGRAIEATVGDMERQFAATMARRDFRAFADYVSEEAVFLGGSDAVRRILRGRSAVGE